MKSTEGKFYTMIRLYSWALLQVTAVIRLEFSLIARIRGPLAHECFHNHLCYATCKFDPYKLLSSVAVRLQCRREFQCYLARAEESFPIPRESKGPVHGRPCSACNGMAPTRPGGIVTGQ
jgi:hypothetical protein